VTYRSSNVPRIGPWLLALSVLLGGVSCARLVPVPDPTYTVASDRYGSTQMVGPVALTARVEGWPQDASLSRLEPYVTVFYVEVRNGGEHSIGFKVSDVALVDDQGTLYRPLAPERLEALLRVPNPIVTGDVVTRPFDSDLAATLSALVDGQVAPGTQVRGAVYFQYIVDRTETLTLRLSVAGQVREFRFRVE